MAPILAQFAVGVPGEAAVVRANVSEELEKGTVVEVFALFEGALSEAALVVFEDIIDGVGYGHLLGCQSDHLAAPEMIPR